MVNATKVGSAKIGKYFFIDFSIIFNLSYIRSISKYSSVRRISVTPGLCGIGTDTVQIYYFLKVSLLFYCPFAAAYSVAQPSTNALTTASHVTGTLCILK